MSTSPHSQPRVPRKRAETRLRLLAAAQAVFFEHGITAVKLDAICERAGYTRGAFYSNFSSIEDVLRALYAEHTADLLDRLEAAVHSPALDQASLSVEDAVEVIMDALPLDVEWLGIRLSVAADAPHHAESASLVLDFDRAVGARLEPLVVTALQRVGRRPTVPADTLARAIMSAHDGALLRGSVISDTDAVRRLAVRGVVLGLSEPAHD